MSIEIIPEPTIRLTQEQHNQFMAEYEKKYQFYAGKPPTFETFVRRKLDGTVCNYNQAGRFQIGHPAYIATIDD